MEFRKDRYYWVRFKFTPTLHLASPYEVREGRVTWWSMPWYNSISPIKGDRLEALMEIPFPEGYSDRGR